MSTAIVESICIFLHSISNSFGIFANGLVIYLTLFKTPDNLKTYSILLFNSGFVDFIACLTALLVQQRIIPTGSSLMLIPSGPCKFISGRFCHILHGICIHCYMHGMYSLMIAFIYRFYILKGWTFSKKFLVSILAIFYIPSLLQLILFSMTYNDPTTLALILHKRFPNYEFDDKFVSGSLSIFEWKILYVTLHVCLPITPIYIIIFFCRRNILKRLEANEMSLTNRTRKMHRDLLMVGLALFILNRPQALSFQALLPFLYSAGVIIFFLGATQLYNSPFLELTAFLIVGLCPSLAPIATLYYIRPYNLILQNYLRRKKIEPETVYQSSVVANTSLKQSESKIILQTM